MRSPKRSKNNLIVAAIVLGPLIIGVGLFVVAPTALIRYDETHQTDVTCTVTSAEGGVRSSVSRIGAGHRSRRCGSRPRPASSPLRDG